MSPQITKLFGAIVVLFALLLVWTSRWTVFDAGALNNNPLNRRVLIDQLRIKRGRIFADDNSALAKSVPAGGGTWSRTYPTGPLFAQAVGYSNIEFGSAAGLERTYAPQLRGVQTGLSTVFGQFGTHQRVGDDVMTTLDPKAQTVARQALAGRAGSVVALNPQTGAVKVMYSNPTYDDNTPQANCGPGCQVNSAVFAKYPPGSTFKVVTAAAALDSGKYTPNSIVNGDSPKTISGVPLNNDNNQSFGPVDLTTALAQSVNTVWAQVAEALGRGTMTTYMKRFGFYSLPPLDYPAGEMLPSRPYSQTSGKPLPPGSPDEDIGRIAIGQGGLGVTPLQMAMVAAAVANGGKLMRPHFATKAVDQTGRTVQSYNPTEYRRVMGASAAGQLAQMMRKVVDEGTGTPAQLGSGIPFAGKTGTASIGLSGQGLTQPWFIGFAPIQNPKVAIAVTIDRSQGGFGGQVAAPIAKQVVQTLLSEGQ
jgi:peptidoglycan glycosyltransferase